LELVHGVTQEYIRRVEFRPTIRVDPLKRTDRVLELSLAFALFLHYGPQTLRFGP
jgi:hypothetical protein